MASYSDFIQAIHKATDELGMPGRSRVRLDNDVVVWSWAYGDNRVDVYLIPFGGFAVTLRIVGFIVTKYEHSTCSENTQAIDRAWELTDTRSEDVLPEVERYLRTAMPQLIRQVDRGTEVLA